MFSTCEERSITVDASAFYPSIEEYYDTGELPFYRVGDVDGMIDDKGALRIPEHLCASYPTLKRVVPGDILLTKGGAIDRSGYVLVSGAVSRDLIFMKTSHLPENERLTLFAYFGTDLFRRLLTRSSSQTAQPHLTITLVRTLPMFIGTDRLSGAVSKCILKAYQAEDRTYTQIKQAEDALLAALGLADWTPPEPLSYSARASDASAAGRLDARFFAPRIQALLDILGRDGRSLGDLAASRRQKFRPQDSGTFNYIEIGDIDGAGAATSTPLACADAPSRATWHVRPNDIITSTVRPIRRLSAQIAPEQDGFVASSGFVVIHPQQIAPELLLTFLRLPVICELLDLYASASMYPAVTEAHILGLPFPEIDAAVEAQVVANIREAREAKGQAAQLLEAAKRAVEIAIEDGEDAALAFLDEAEGID